MDELVCLFMDCIYLSVLEEGRWWMGFETLQARTYGLNLDLEQSVTATKFEPISN